MEIFVLIQPKAVAGTGADPGFPRKITVGFRGQRLKNSLRARIHILLEHDIDPKRFGRPDPKVRPSGRDHFGADRIAASKFLHVLNSPISFGAVAVDLKLGCR